MNPEEKAQAAFVHQRSHERSKLWRKDKVPRGGERTENTQKRK